MSHIQITDTASTNQYLTELSRRKALPEFTCVSTDFQHAGKGQRGNSWESEPGKNLLFSLLFRPEFLTAQHQFLLSEAVAVAIHDILNAFAEGFSIKWPNDIYYRNSKICGILIENEWQGQRMEQSIVGIGLNVNQISFHSDAPNPIALISIIGKETDRTTLLDSIIRSISKYYTLLRQRDYANIQSLYKRALYRRVGYHRYRDAHSEFRARIIQVEMGGRLVLEDDQKQIRRYAFKEVSFY